MKKILVVIIFLALISVIYMISKYRDISEYMFLKKYCKEVTLELLRLNRSCDCSPAKINNSYGCLCSCEIKNKTLNVFVKVVES